MDLVKNQYTILERRIHIRLRRTWVQLPSSVHKSPSFEGDFLLYSSTFPISET